MSIHSRCFDNLSWPEAKVAAGREGSTVIWPLGAFEQHGPHLPLATDRLFAERIIKNVLEHLPESAPIWTLPSGAFGFSPEHASFPGTISLSASLFLQLLTEVGQQLAGFGFSRLILFNAHGGQIGLLQSAARELRGKCPSMAVLPCFLWSGIDALQELLPSVEIERGLHAGLAETSLMLALSPNLVGLDRPVDGDHSSDGEIATPPKGWSLEGAAPCAWLTKDLSISGVIGNSEEANASLGKRIETVVVEHWVALLTGLMASNWPPTNV